MKGAERTAVVIRKPNGRLHIKTELLKKPGKLRKIPILRGVFVFVDALVTGTRTLLYSAEVLEEAEGSQDYEKDKMTLWLEKNLEKRRIKCDAIFFCYIGHFIHRRNFYYCTYSHCWV